MAVIKNIAYFPFLMIVGELIIEWDWIFVCDMCMYIKQKLSLIALPNSPTESFKIAAALNFRWFWFFPDELVLLRVRMEICYRLYVDIIGWVSDASDKILGITKNVRIKMII